MTKILVVEDENLLREDLVDILSLQGFDVISAPNGRQGVETALQAIPDLIVCDIAMPEMDGYEVLQHLRRHEHTAGIPFIFLTARVERDDMRYGMELGADDYITKPFTTDELVNAICSRIERLKDVTLYNAPTLQTAKKQLTHMVAHELRTPMVSISTVQSYIGQQFETLSRDELRNLLDILESGSHRLSHLVEQTVLLTQMGTGNLTREIVEQDGLPTDSWTLVSTAISTARQFAYRNATNPIMSDIQDGDRLIKAHSQALVHAIAEIVTNALDFSAPGEEVQVVQWVEGKTVYIQVSDHGVGMPSDQLDRVIQPFYQIRRDKNEQQGMGLGLALAYGVVQAHSGDLHMRSMLGEGTEIVIALPEWH